MRSAVKFLLQFLTKITPLCSVLGFGTISKQHAAHAQQRFYSIHADSFASSPKSSSRIETLRPCWQGNKLLGKQGFHITGASTMKSKSGGW